MVMIYNLADTFFVGRTGDTYMVAAVSYALPIFMIPSAIGNLFGIGGTSVISRAMGRGDTEYAKKVSSFCFWTGTAVWIICTVILIVFSAPLSRMLGTTSPEYLQSAVDALNIILTAEDIKAIEKAIPPDKISGRSMRNFRFTNGQMSLT